MKDIALVNLTYTCGEQGCQSVKRMWRTGAIDQPSCRNPGDQKLIDRYTTDFSYVHRGVTAPRLMEERVITSSVCHHVGIQATKYKLTDTQ